MDSTKPPPAPAPRAKGVWYWFIATVVVTFLLLSLPLLALAVIEHGADPMAVLGLLISAPGVVLVSAGLFRPALLFRGYRTEPVTESEAAGTVGRFAAVFLGAGFMAGGIAFALTTEPLFALLSAMAAGCLLAIVLRYV